VSGHLTPDNHAGCNAALCNVECLSDLSIHLEMYLELLSRLLFRKENIRSNRQWSWWLRTFYSLCIQSLVRKLLVAIVDGQANDKNSPNLLPAKQYLHIALQLFLASSGTYDPLISSYTTDDTNLLHEDDAQRAEQYKAARTAVQQATWADQGIRSTSDYLIGIFEADGNNSIDP
jgi:hypothetical protein